MKDIIKEYTVGFVKWLEYSKNNEYFKLKMAELKTTDKLFDYWFKNVKNRFKL